MANPEVSLENLYRFFGLPLYIRRIRAALNWYKIIQNRDESPPVPIEMKCCYNPRDVDFGIQPSESGENFD